MLWSLSGCAAPKFEISSLEGTPTKPVAGESFAVDAVVSNTTLVRIAMASVLDVIRIDR